MTWYQVYDNYIFSKNFMLAYTWDMTWISKIKMFVHGISSSYLFVTFRQYFEMSYPMDISITNIQVCTRDILGMSSFHSATGPCRLGSLAAPSDPGCHSLFITVMCLSSVTATERPPGGAFRPPRGQIEFASTHNLIFF